MKSRPQPAYEKSVFINCPFDPQFQNLLLAIVFAVTANGFVPRSARETEGNAEPRFLRILQAMSRSKYSIHDLSRFTGEGIDNVARFNMPLELGIACALRFVRERSARSHNWLVLVPEGFAYQKFVSDLSGFDPGRHSQTVESVIREVSSWLKLQEDVTEPVPSALRIYQAFATFQTQVAGLRSEALEKESWADLVQAASRFAPSAEV
jgi:hypothetical protein